MAFAQKFILGLMKTGGVALLGAAGGAVIGAFGAVIQGKSAHTGAVAGAAAGAAGAVTAHLSADMLGHSWFTKIPIILASGIAAATFVTLSTNTGFTPDDLQNITPIIGACMGNAAWSTFAPNKSKDTPRTPPSVKKNFAPTGLNC